MTSFCDLENLFFYTKFFKQFVGLKNCRCELTQFWTGISLMITPLSVDCIYGLLCM